MKALLFRPWVMYPLLTVATWLYATCAQMALAVLTQPCLVNLTPAFIDAQQLALYTTLLFTPFGVVVFFVVFWIKSVNGTIFASCLFNATAILLHNQLFASDVFDVVWTKVGYGVLFVVWVAMIYRLVAGPSPYDD